jgi:hypothetical protein
MVAAQSQISARSWACTLKQIARREASLLFALLGLDSDNGGEFINHHLVACLGQRPKLGLFTRGRTYRKNNNARVEQRSRWFSSASPV